MKHSEVHYDDHCSTYKLLQYMMMNHLSIVQSYTPIIQLHTNTNEEKQLLCVVYIWIDPQMHNTPCFLYSGLICKSICQRILLVDDWQESWNRYDGQETQATDHQTHCNTVMKLIHHHLTHRASRIRSQYF